MSTDNLPLHYLAAAEYAEEILNDVEDSINLLLEDLRELEAALYRSGEADEEVIKKLAEARNILISAKQEARDIRAALREIRYGRRLDAHDKAYEKYLAKKTSELLSRALALMNLPEKALEIIRDVSVRLGVDEVQEGALII